MNYSAGGSGYSQSLFDALVAARDAGVLCAASAGNDQVDTDESPHYPASYDVESVVSVASTDHGDSLSSFSNWGAVSVDLGAPGSYILSTLVPFVTLFSEDFQSASPPDIGDQFTLGGPTNYWGTVSTGDDNIAARGDAQQSYPYRPNSDGWIVTPSLDTADLRGPSLSVSYRYEMEDDDDVLIGEIWDGAEWQQILRKSSTCCFQETYFTSRIDTDPYRNSAQRLRFGWQTDADFNDYFGGEIDEISIRYIGSDYTSETAYGLNSGTSMAAPHVTGAAALLLANRPDMCLTELRNRLVYSGDPLSALEGITVSGRRLNVHNALAASPGVAVTAPNGGEHWGLGASHEIQWSAFHCYQPPEYVNVHLLKGGGVHSQLADNAPNTGTFVWSVPADLPMGSDYRIRVDDGITVDESDADFSLRPPYLYVDDDAPMGGDGLTWDTAYKYLQDALAVAAGGDEIYVAGGTYKPDVAERAAVVPGSRNATFHFISGVRLRGGYAGLANPGDPDLRNMQSYETILSGDLSGNDAAVSDPVDLYDEPTRAENSYHVVTACIADATAALDGLTIAGGQANGNFAWGQGYGGGMYNCPGSSPTVTGCTFRENFATRYGGGMYNHADSSPAVTDCMFVGNYAANGGGMYNGTGATAVTDSVFSGNVAGQNGGGGGMYTSGDPTVRNCIFQGNRANFGGGIQVIFGGPILTNCRFSANSGSNGGGMHNYAGNPTLSNCTFSGNTAPFGGGLLNADGSSATLSNCTFSRNTAATVGGGMCNIASANLTVTNCIFWGDSPDEFYNALEPGLTVTYSDVQGGAGQAWFGTGCIDTDPLFIDADGPDDVPGNEDDNLRLSTDSPCIDAGINTAAATGADLDGNPRIMDGNADGTSRVDMGVYEYFLDCNENNYPDVCDADCMALDGACDIPGCGTSGDCNGNSLPDDCDLADGTSEDCNTNTVPDECEPDCNSTGQPDDCDIAAGTSEDLDTNGIPDECECATIAESLQTPDGQPGYAKCRYISFVPRNSGEYTALRVTLLDLPAPFDIHNGTKMWVGEPITEVSENAGKIDPADAPGYGTFWSARLSCGPPIYRDDWTTKSPLHVYSDAIVPGAEFEVQAIHETCDVIGEPNYSAPLAVTTSRWGDLVGHCAVIPCSPPDRLVGIPTDVTACLDKFKNL
ncbi:MAG: S8 family serine peptidase, partial [Phycisphaerales bacterium]